jgi:GGDEF domain-containing protein
VPQHDLGRSAHLHLVGDAVREQPLFVHRDALTGCLNYAGLLETLQWELERCATLGLDLACCLMALDGCHDRDRRLPAVGRALRRAVETDDTIGRYGRDQFVALLPGTDADAGIARAERMCAAVRAVDAGFAPHAGVARAGRFTRADRLLGDAYRALCAATVGEMGTVAKA